MCVVKMAILQLLAFCLATILVVEAGLKVDCGSPSGKPAVITYSGDAVAVIAFAADTKQCRFVEDTATATFKLTMAYKKTAGIDCLLEQTVPSRPSYGTIVETRLLHELVEGGEDEKYVVECVFSPIKTDVTLNVALKPKYNPPIFILKTSGIVSKSGFTVFITDSSNKGLKIVSESQIVKLRTSMTPKGGEKGYQPIQCTAESMDRTVKLLILSDGCGTGFPWRYDQGFQMNNFFGDSPNFRMFRIRKKEGVVFKCTFVVCPTTCNENSCYKKSKTRRRRDLHRRVRRSLGVKYNPLGLVSHEESTGVEAAHVTVEPEDAAPITVKQTEAHMAPKEHNDMGYGKYASSRKIDGTFEFVMGNDAPKSHDTLNAEHQADKYHSDAVHQPESIADHEVPQPEHSTVDNHADQPADWHADDVVHQLEPPTIHDAVHQPESIADHEVPEPEYSVDDHAFPPADSAVPQPEFSTDENALSEPVADHDVPTDDYGVAEPQSVADHDVPQPEPLTIDAVHEPEHAKEQDDMGYGNHATSRKIDGTFEFVMGNYAPKSYDKLYAEPPPEHPTVDASYQPADLHADNVSPEHSTDAVHEPESIADHEETPPEDSNVDDNVYQPADLHADNAVHQLEDPNIRNALHHPESVADHDIPEPEDSFDDNASPPADSAVPRPEFPTDKVLHEPESIADQEVSPPEHSTDDAVYQPADLHADNADNAVHQPEYSTIDDHAVKEPAFIRDHEVPQPEDHAFQPTDAAIPLPEEPYVDDNALQVTDSEEPRPDEPPVDDPAFQPTDTAMPPPEEPYVDDNALYQPESIDDHAFQPTDTAMPPPEEPYVDDNAVYQPESIDDHAFQPTDNAVSEPGYLPVDENAFQPSEQSVESYTNGESNQEFANAEKPFSNWNEPMNAQDSPVSEASNVKTNLKLSLDIGEWSLGKHSTEDDVGNWDDSEETLVDTPILEINGDDDDETISEKGAGDGFTDVNADFPGTETTLDKEYETANHEYKDVSTDEHKLKDDAAVPESEMKEPEWSDNENWWHGGDNSFNDPGELTSKTSENDMKILHDDLAMDGSHLAHDRSVVAETS